jgi:hypothetical protein
MVLAPPDEEGLLDLKEEYERFRERHPDATREDFIAYLRAGALKRQVEERLQPPAPPTPEFRKQQATLEDLQRRAYGTPVSPAAERAKRLREMTEQRLQPAAPAPPKTREEFVERAQEIAQIPIGLTRGLAAVAARQPPEHPHPAIEVPLEPTGWQAKVAGVGEAALKPVGAALQEYEVSILKPAAATLWRVISKPPTKGGLLTPTLLDDPETLEEYEKLPTGVKIALETIADPANVLPGVGLGPEGITTITKFVGKGLTKEGLTEAREAVRVAVSKVRKGILAPEEAAQAMGREGEGIAPMGRARPRELAPTPEDVAIAKLEQATRAKYKASLPTIQEIERRSIPLPPEVRAALNPTARGDVGRIWTFEEVATLWGKRYQENWWTKFSDLLSGVIPALRGPLARTEADVAVRNAMTSHDLYVITMGEKARARLWIWLDEAKDTLGVSMKTGRLSKVTPKEGVEIPKNLRSVINHVVEFREKYNLTPAQNTLLDELTEQGVVAEVLRLEQGAGIKIQEIENYFPRYAKKTPPGVPTGGGGAGRLGTRPRHARHRVFGDVEARYAAGYEDDPIPALFGRVQSGIEATANAETVKTIKAMGLKPSELIDPVLVQAAKDARQEYKLTRAAAIRKGATADEKLAVELADTKLEDSIRALRFAAGLAREKGPKVFGRVVSQDVADAFRRYVKDLPESWVDDIFQVARGTMVQGDLSAAGIQTWFTFYRNTPAWGMGMVHGVEGLLTEPTGYLARNYEPLMRALDVVAVRPPTEFLLGRGGRMSRWLAKVPGIKQSQRAFEWQTFVGQTERWKAVERLTKTPEDMLEMAAVLRKQSGIFIMPGMTRSQASTVGKLMFAPQFAQAIHSALFDVFRGGPAGREAMKSVMMAFGGSAALTVAVNYKLNGEYPNMTDPDKPGLWGIKVGDGYIYPFGPYQPTIVALTRTSRAINDARQGKTPDARDLQAVPRLLESKAGIPARMVIAVMDALGIPLTAIRGEPYEYLRLKTPEDWVKWASQYTPIGLRQAAQGVRVSFPPALLEILGVRTSPMPTWGGIDLEVKSMGFKNSQGTVIEHYRDLTEPQKIEAEKNPKIKAYMARAEGHDDTSKMFAAIETDRTNRFAWAAFELRNAGPTPDALKRYADSIAGTKADNAAQYRLLEIGGVLDRTDPENPDVKLRRQYEEYTGRARAPDQLLDGELYGQYDHNFRAIIGDEIARTVLDPQLVADRNPQVQQSQVWSLSLGQSGYYDLNKADGSPDPDARERFRTSNPTFDVMGYLLGRWSKVQTQMAAQLAEDWFKKWMAGIPIPVGAE